MSDKKQDFSGLPTSAKHVELGSPSGYKRTRALAIGLCLGLLGTGGFVLRTVAPKFAVSKSHHDPAALCPQVKPITPTKHSAIWESFTEKTTTDEYKTRAIEWLCGAVRIPYVCYPSSAWNRILTARSGLSRTIKWTLWAWIPVGRRLDPSTVICCILSPECIPFPRIRIASLLIGLQPFHLILDQSQHLGFGLRVARVRRKPQAGLIYRSSRYGKLRIGPWNLSESVPTDVVPVNPETVSEWKYPPYSGYYDGMLSLNRGDMIPTIRFRREDMGAWQR